MTKNQMLAEELMILARKFRDGEAIVNPLLTAATLCIAASELRSKSDYIPEFIRKEAEAK